MEYFYWKFTKPAIEILILWIIYYRMLAFFIGTRAFQVLKGMAYLLVLFLFCQILGLDTLNWLLTKLFALSIIGMIVLFQQELRQGLARLGERSFFSLGLEEKDRNLIIAELSDALFRLAKQKVGCLLAIERTVKLETYISSGIALDARISSELIQSVFLPVAPAHDGGAIIRRDRIAAIACLFPLTENPHLSKIIGTRHRAALGITEHTDAIVLMVSEETGEISIAMEGRFIPVVNKERLINLLQDILFNHNAVEKQ
ncbi:MAG: TIGR00159 family protein [Candidatus Omnitrophica bacterium]|nr:TIGR00159 family protein [Candidatus Omnitrophota bacterium]